MAVVTPKHVFYYDPAGATDDQSRVVVFYDEAKHWDSDGRPSLWVLDGGGWLPNSGKVFDEFETAPNQESILHRLYAQGWALNFVAYTVTDVALDGDGAFDYSQWRTTAGGALVLDSVNTSKLNRRSSEKDFVHALQYQRSTEIGDLSQLPARQGAFGKSAGSLTGSFCAFGPNRADAAAAPGSRFTKNTRLAFFISQSTIASWAAWVPSKAVAHLTDFSGGVAPTVGDALAASGGGFLGGANARLASPLWQLAQTGTELTPMREANAQMPVWLEVNGTQEYFGPYDYGSMLGVLNADHPVESVFALRTALVGLQTEFPVGYVHGTLSAFVINYPGTLDEKADLMEGFVSTAVSVVALPPVVSGLVVEDGTGLPDANCYTTLDAAEGYIADFAPVTAAWDALTTPGKEKKLRQATAFLDQHLGQRWRGYAKTSEQALDWPRYDVYDHLGASVGANSIPKVLADATAELAAIAAQNPNLPLGGAVGPSAAKALLEESIEVGPIKRSRVYAQGSAYSSTGFPGSGAAAGILPAIEAMLAPLIESFGQGRIYRS